MGVHSARSVSELLTRLRAAGKKRLIRGSYRQWAYNPTKVSGRKSCPNHLAAVPETAPERPGRVALRIPIIVTLVWWHVTQLEPLTEWLGEERGSSVEDP